VAYEEEGVCARSQAGDMMDGGRKRASYCLDASIHIDIQRRHLFRYTIDRSSCLRHERITYTNKQGAEAMATWHCDTTASIRLIATAFSYQHMPAPSRPSIYRAPRAITPRYRTHYDVIRRRRGSENDVYT
jgi:hypothetical protein